MIETRCAVCRLDDGLVINIIIAHPSELAPDECQLVEIMNEQVCNTGWCYDGVTFSDPNPTVEEDYSFSEEAI
jgi:hypothetical protein